MSTQKSMATAPSPSLADRITRPSTDTAQDEIAASAGGTTVTSWADDEETAPTALPAASTDEKKETHKDEKNEAPKDEKKEAPKDEKKEGTTDVKKEAIKDVKEAPKHAPDSVSQAQTDGAGATSNGSDLHEPNYDVEVKLSDIQADPNNPLYSVKSFEDLGGL